MYFFTIGKKEFKLPESLKDITLSKYKKVSEFYELHKPSEEDTERDFISYYIDFISLFLDIEKDYLKQVRITSDDGFGITELYQYLLKFLDKPDFTDFKPSESVKLNGVKYYCTESNLNVLKHQKPLEKLTFEEYEDCVTILQNFDAIKYDKQDALSLLTAIIYRPKVKGWFKSSIEAYNSDKVKERAEIFQDIDMHTVYSAYFFLNEQIATSTENLKHYSKKEKAKRVNRLVGILARKH